MRARVLVTGGAGFIGQALVRRLAESCDVVIYDDFRRSATIDAWLRRHEAVTVVRGDVRDKKCLHDAVEGVDTIVHAAAIAGIGTVDSDPVETMEVNYHGTVNVLAAANAHRITDRVVILSTSEVFGPQAEHVTEEHSAVVAPATAQRWVYAAGKLAAEHMAFAYQRKYDLPVVVVRPFNVYGPGQVGEGAIRMFIEAALAGKPLTIRGEGDQVRSWCYIDDFIEGLMACVVNKKARGQIWNIGNPAATLTIRQLAEWVMRAVPSESSLEFMAPSAQDVQVRIPDVSKAVQQLGFYPAVGLDEGIKRTATWLEAVQSVRV